MPTRCPTVCGAQSSPTEKPVGQGWGGRGDFNGLSYLNVKVSEFYQTGLAQDKVPLGPLGPQANLIHLTH